MIICEDLLMDKSTESEEVALFKVETDSIEQVLFEAVQKAYMNLSIDGYAEELNEQELKVFCENVEIVKISDTEFQFCIEDFLFTANIKYNH